MKNILWIIGGVAIGYYLATKATGFMSDLNEAVPQNQNQVLTNGSTKGSAVNDFPRSYSLQQRYVNKDSLVEARMVV